jgi:hypothetical protein
MVHIIERKELWAWYIKSKEHKGPVLQAYILYYSHTMGNLSRLRARMMRLLLKMIT